ncbi:sigma factor-like helix-turn-helix DNA-binding protein [Fodinicola acaciae]|uniref:sigma factor-like helix-turn-helix DNA-binding protein n=1 Tax=Fodinicola acaciae TaxID=2681555 RepID=UPI0013CFB8AD|nr:sigma factor-like helix-turn-helix DNA-binding protein [Fodinicola acaciae]
MRKPETEQLYADEFRVFLENRYAVLLRFGYLLTGDLAEAEELLDSVLANARRHWHFVRYAGAEVHVRKRLLTLALASWWRVLLGSRRKKYAPPRAEVTAPDDETAAMWQRLAGLPRLQRAILVLQYDENLPLPGISEIVGLPPKRITRLATEALHRLETA